MVKSAEGATQLGASKASRLQVVSGQRLADYKETN